MCILTEEYPRRVICKEQNTRLWQTDGWGNRLYVWRHLQDFYADYQNNKVKARYLTLRYVGPINEIQHRFCAYNLLPAQIQTTVAQWTAQGADLHRIMINETAPDTRVALQGELWTGLDRWNYLLYSTVRKHMRDALREQSQSCEGLRTQLLLQQYMSPSSFTELQALQYCYTDHVIEFSVYDCFLGHLPGRNTLVWEIRQY